MNFLPDNCLAAFRILSFAQQFVNLFAYFITVRNENESYVSRMARINSLAGDEFNRGLRSYYFGIASVTWMIHPGLLMAFSALIVFVLIRRDFYSEALEIMSR